MEFIVESPSEQDIIRTYAEKVPFPSYWQFNWNSFEECLRDALSEGKSLHVLHSYSESILDHGIPYLDIIQDASGDFEAFSYQFEPLSAD